MYFILHRRRPARRAEAAVTLDGAAGSRSLAGSVGPIPGALFTIAFPLADLVPARPDARTDARSTRSARTTRPRSRAASTSPLVRVVAYALGGLFAGVGGIALIGAHRARPTAASRRPTRCSRSRRSRSAARRCGAAAAGCSAPLLGAASHLPARQPADRAAGRPELAAGRCTAAMLVIAVVLERRSPAAAEGRRHDAPPTLARDTPRRPSAPAVAAARRRSRTASRCCSSSPSSSSSPTAAIDPRRPRELGQRSSRSSCSSALVGPRLGRADAADPDGRLRPLDLGLHRRRARWS